MRYSTEFRDPALVERIVARLRRWSSAPATIMEVCGTHTMSIARFGLKSLLPEATSLVSGPGCPVCVTDQHDIDSFLALGRLPGVVLASFGDMVRVPGSVTSLERLRAEGADVRVVYSPLDAVDLAVQHPGSQVVFLGVGFETTAPAVALAIQTAAEQRLTNFTVYCVHKTIPAALRALLSGTEMNLSGLLLPGHVSTVIGADAYKFVADGFGIPCAIAGFEPVDVLMGVDSILRQIDRGKPTVDNVYPRAVPRVANGQAMNLLEDVFVPSDAKWRGLGVIPVSGLAIADAYAGFDAKTRFADALADVPEPIESGCACGSVLRGLIGPRDCAFFGQQCTPAEPFGPCMVSSEGACAAEYKYGGPAN